MKIAQVAPPWIAIPPQSYGSTENAIYHLVEELVALGHEVTLFAPADARTSAKQVSFIPRSLITEGVPWQANLKAYYHLHKSLEYIAEHDFDIIHTHLSSSSDMYIFPLTATLPTPHMTTLHGYFPFDRTLDNWTGDADNYFMEWARDVPLIAISESARKHVLHLAPSVTFAGTIHHGIQMQHYKPDNIQSGEALVWLGRFTYEKGAHLAIEAALKAGVPLILAGIKEQQSRDAMEYYRHLVEPYIDGERIRYLGPITTQHKIALLQQARALLNPIEWDEPFGVEMIEAMATGCPVISFARGAAPEIIWHGQTGFLANDVGEMTHYISQLDSIDRQIVRAHTAQYFAARVMATKYLDVYTRVIASQLTKATETSIKNTQPLVQVKTENMLSV
ncbi:glycosyl transferase [Dictyobacter alpinus]|uniref:Glycosyl transferase n=1 Tax=Dictyobacter alpinus TaxID=2014873 RepID=A0A402B321_9CHLR|nr:glycosyltransferase family 4 protein [Dictyobacter alpinus]GCE25752.1 glycosyl transferase [Dictyobacter alpinus]